MFQDFADDDGVERFRLVWQLLCYADRCANALRSETRHGSAVGIEGINRPAPSFDSSLQVSVASADVQHAGLSFRARGYEADEIVKARLCLRETVEAGTLVVLPDPVVFAGPVKLVPPGSCSTWYYFDASRAKRWQPAAPYTRCGERIHWRSFAESSGDKPPTSVRPSWFAR